MRVIDAVKKKLGQLRTGLPVDVRIVPTYDRSALIHRAINHLRDTLVEEMLIVALVCIVFLLHGDHMQGKLLHFLKQFRLHLSDRNAVLFDFGRRVTGRRPGEKNK